MATTQPRRSRLALAALAALVLGVACAGAGRPDNAAIVERVPFAGGERAVYALHDNSGAVVARGTLSVASDGERLVLAQSYVRTDGDGLPSDEVFVTVDPQTLTPLQLVRAVQSADGEDRYSATYQAAVDEDATVLFDSTVDGSSEQRELDLRRHYYDNESSLWLWRTIGFADGYEQRYTSVNHLDRSQQTVILRVIDRRTIEVPAGTFETWRLQVRNGRATRIAWVNVEPPHQVVQWDNGSIVFRLEEFRPAAR